MGAHFDELAAVAELGFAVYLVYRFEAEDFCGQQQGLGCAVELELDYGAFGQAVFAHEIDSAGADIAGCGFETLRDAYGKAWAIGRAHV